MENIQFRIDEDWNHGLGFIPVSLFVELGNGVDHDLESAFEILSSHECNDVIFYGSLKEHQWTLLRYLIPRLRSEGKFVHVYSNIPQVFSISATRRIMPVTMDIMRRLESQIAVQSEAGLLTEHDVFLIVDDEIGKLRVTRKRLLPITKAIIFFSAEAVDPLQVLKEGLYDVIPYRGKRFGLHNAL